MKYHWWHFTGIDWDHAQRTSAIYKIVGPNKGWATDVSKDNGNYDFLMFADLDYSRSDVQRDVLQWGEWIGTELPLSGMRIDGAKHFSAAFQKKFVDHLRKTFGPDYFIFGEYLDGNLNVILEYLRKMEYQLSMLDIPLAGKMSYISELEGGDLRKIFDGTLVGVKPANAVVS